MFQKIKNKINNSPYSKILNGDDYSTYNYFYGDASEKAFNKEIKKFLTNFESLDGYLFYKILGYNQKYELRSDYIKFGINIFDWILGERVFPGEEYLSLLYNDDQNIYNKRRKCLYLYFKSELQETLNEYDYIFSLLDSIKTFENYKNDILIDGRNLTIENNQLINLYSPKEKYQNKIEAEEINITAPIYDRLKVNLFEKSFDDSFKEETLPPSSVYYSSGLKEALNKVQNLILLTVYNGSITHLKLCRKTIFNLLYNYTRVYKDYNFFEYLLYMSAISMDFKTNIRIKDFIRRKYGYNLTKETIDRLFSFKDMVNKQYKIYYLSFFYNNYKYFISDEVCRDIESQLLKYIYKNKKPIINFLYEILKCFKDSEKLKDYILLFKTLEFMINNNYRRFYRDISDIINNIDINKLNDRQYKRYIKIVKKLLNIEDINIWNSISNILSKNHNTRGLKKYNNHDKVLAYSKYEKMNSFDLLKEAFDYYNKVYLEKEKNPGVEKGLDYYRLTFKEVEENSYNDAFRTYIENNFTEISNNILKSEKQSNYLKSEVLRFVMTISSIRAFDFIKDKVIAIINGCSPSKVKPNEFINMFYNNSINDINIYLEIQTIKKLYDEDENIKVFYEYIMSDNLDSSIYLTCLLCIVYKYKDNSNVLDDIYNLCCVMLKKPELYERCNVIYLFKYFDKSLYKKVILEKLELLSVNCDYDVAKSIQAVLETYSDSDISKIVENFKKSNDSRIIDLYRKDA